MTDVPPFPFSMPPSQDTCCVCGLPIDPAKIWLLWHGGLAVHERCEETAEVMRPLPIVQLQYTDGQIGVLKLSAMRMHPPIYSVVEIEPFYPALVDARTKSGRRALKHNFGKHAKQKQVLREKAKQLRRGRR